MLKFFRKIRQQLLAKNKFTKYLLYAAGEIVLVVIGILIALQINQWKKASDNRKLEKTFLNFVKEDLHDDIENLQMVANFKLDQLETNKRLLAYFIHPSYPIADTIQFVNDIVKTTYFILPNSNKTAFETAKSTGQINLVSNNKLVKELSVYFTDITLDQHVTETKRFTNAYAEAVLMKNYNIFSKEVVALDGIGGEFQLSWYENDKRTLFSFDDFRRDLEIENHLNSYTIRLTIGINYLKNKIEKAKELINLIDQHLSER